MIELFILFTLKHFVCDFVLQFPRHYLNKGTYGKWGGIEHALIHGLGTWLILGFWAGIIDAVIHYHIDWAKMRLNSHYGWKCNETNKFWILLGIDQMLHYLTYAGLIYVFGTL